MQQREGRAPMEGGAQGGKDVVSAELASFLDSGIYRLSGEDGSTVAVFIDPVRVLNASYSRFRISASSYYSRPFHCPPGGGDTGGKQGTTTASPGSKKRKQKNKKKRKRVIHELNEREKAAEKRHREARGLLLRAHGDLLGATELISVLPEIVTGEKLQRDGRDDGENNFIELRSLWQAPLFEISLCSGVQSKLPGTEGSKCGERTLLQIFNNLVSNDTEDDLEAEFLNNRYILPRRSCFYMSDLRQLHNLIPAHSDQGFNLIVVDPPWENGSANQKSVYPTLPNRYFLHLPISQLAHSEGALVALWVTNREKLRMFVEKELFPSWGVTYHTSFYWLKVKVDGSLIGELDLFHHRPYECLLLGYIHGKVDSEVSESSRHPQNKQVVISIPGAFSRKPPVGKLLIDYIPGPKPSNCIELFSRELLAGWTSWGNESLHFQDSRYFMSKSLEDTENF